MSDNQAMRSRDVARLLADEDEACFGQMVANSATATMLDLRFRSGERRALPYSYIADVQYNPDRGITILFVGYRVELTGSNFERIYQALIEQRVRFLREPRWGQQAVESEPYIERISIAET